MEQLFIFGGLSGLVWIFIDIMRPKKAAEAPKEKEAPPADADIKTLFETVKVRPDDTVNIARIKEIHRIARMYNAMRPVGSPAFFDLPDAQIMAIIQRYKGGAA